MRTGFLAAMLAVAGLVGCQRGDDGIQQSTDRLDEAETEPVVFVTEREAVEKLEASGMSFHELLGAQGPAASLVFASSEPYRAIAATIAADVSKTIADHEASGRSSVGFGDSSRTSLAKFSYRTFAPQWMQSPDAHFELVAVSSRFDRREVRKGTCGETRFVYRMAYDGPRESSRLPLTLLLAFAPSGATCKDVAQKWMAPKGLSGEALGTWLAKGPLAGIGDLLAVELNFESARWPSSLQPEFGGQDEYVLRVFKPSGGSLVPVLLENTPDSARIAGDADLKARLRQWIEENRAGVEAGSAILPDEFLTETVKSVATRGLARHQNRPFRQIFTPDELGLDAPKRLLRRLDTMTCNGCHQARSIVGFHVLGEERLAEVDEHFVNAVAVGVSPHVTDEIRRRKKDIETFLRIGSRPTAMPDVENAAGIYGSKCGLDPEFADWTCEAGLSCKNTDGDELGTCQPSAGPTTGDACEEARMSFAASMYSDSAKRLPKDQCLGGSLGAGHGCPAGVDAFPGGSCLGVCSAADRGHNVGPMQVCSDIPFGARFDQCFGFTSFESCMAETVLPTTLRACDVEHPCRDDYVCARVRNRPAHGSIADDAGGGCIPPYALIQMEVDTHLLR